ncbi:MAG: hypothetical protein WC977_05135 [Anaerovoracaceae bacterium]|jgi:hypothetical protein
MRQSSLGTALDALMVRSYDMRASVERRVATDTTEGEWEETIHNLLCTVQDQSARDRQATEAVYSHPVTHIAYCDDDDDLGIGHRLVMSWRMRDRRRLLRHTLRWTRVAESEMYLVLGKHKVSGLPEPHNQVRLDLWQMTPTR